MKKLLFLLTTIICFSACKKYEGEGPIVTQELAIQSFDKLNAADAFDVSVEYGPEQKVLAIGHQNIIDRLKREVSNGKWDIEFERGKYRNYELKIIITTPYVNEIILNGSGNITLNKMALDNLYLGISGSGTIISNDSLTIDNTTAIEISGSGDVTLYYLSTLNTKTRISGSGNIHFTGTTNQNNISISGSGKFNGFPFASSICNIDISGSGNCMVTVNKTLDINISGSGNVYYKGQADVYQKITGTGNSINSN